MIDLAQVDKPTRSEAARFLGHATLGYSMAEVDGLVSLGYKAWLDAQFAIPVSKHQSHFDWLKAKWPYTNTAYRFNTDILGHTAVRKDVEATDTLRQKLAFELSQIIVVSVKVDLGSVFPYYLGAAFLDLITAKAFGNYRDLLVAVSRSPVMARFLTFKGSAKEGYKGGTNSPDENYAREILQLFTVGVENLKNDGTLKDNLEPVNRAGIAQLAKIFTGWVEDFTKIGNGSSVEVFRHPLTYDLAQHDGSAISLSLGPTDTRSPANIPAVNSSTVTPVTRLEAAIDHIYGHPNVAPFVSKLLIQRFVTSNPSPAYVARVAAVFKATGSTLKDVVQAILLDDELFEFDAARGKYKRTGGLQSTTFGKVRQPYSRLIHWARAFGARSSTSKWLLGRYMEDISAPNYLGQMPGMAPSVFNFFRPGYRPPGSVTASRGLVAPELQIVDEVTTVSYALFMQRTIDANQGINSGLDVKATYAAWLAKAANPAGLVDELNILLTAGRLSASNRSRIINAISTMPASNDAGRRQRIQSAILLIMVSPEYLVQK